jgi:3-isopropylmalate/(R)-2-methylmalate dehydratase small subunit
VALGIPCVTASQDDISKLKRVVAADPKLQVTVDLNELRASAGSVSIAVSIPEGARKQLVTGRWDSSTELLEGQRDTAARAKELPYFTHWRG